MLVAIKPLGSLTSPFGFMNKMEKEYTEIIDLGFSADRKNLNLNMMVKT